jgi:hypothetical protein
MRRPGFTGAVITERWGYMLGMSVRKTALLIAATALLSASAGVAQAAEGKGKGIDFTVRTETSAIAPGSQVLRWDAARGRWGLMLNLQQPDSRGIIANDIQAGAYYRITPSLRVGVGGALGDQQMQNAPRKITPEEGQPRVQFETRFKF